MSDLTGPSPRVFVAMMAMLFATTALLIDAMLPALPAIGAEPSPDDPNHAQLVVSLFFAGLGRGTIAGEGIMLFGSWRLIFVSFIVFAVLVQVWVALSLHETLRPEMRRKLQVGLLLKARNCRC